MQRLGYRLADAGLPIRDGASTRELIVAGAGDLMVPVAHSSFRELLATGANECQALIATLVATAAHVQPSVSSFHRGGMMLKAHMR